MPARSNIPIRSQTARPDIGDRFAVSPLTQPTPRQQLKSSTISQGGWSEALMTVAVSTPAGPGL